MHGILGPWKAENNDAGGDGDGAGIGLPRVSLEDFIPISRKVRMAVMFPIQVSIVSLNSSFSGREPESERIVQNCPDSDLCPATMSVPKGILRASGYPTENDHICFCSVWARGF